MADRTIGGTGSSRQRKLPPHSPDWALAKSSGLRGIPGNFDSRARNPHVTIIHARSLGHPSELFGFAIQPIAQPLQLPEDCRYFTCGRRMHFDPDGLFRSSVWPIAETVVPTWLICVAGLLRERRVKIDAPSQPPRVGARHTISMPVLQRLFAWTIRAVHRGAAQPAPPPRRSCAVGRRSVGDVGNDIPDPAGEFRDAPPSSLGDIVRSRVEVRYIANFAVAREIVGSELALQGGVGQISGFRRRAKVEKLQHILDLPAILLKEAQRPNDVEDMGRMGGQADSVSARSQVPSRD